MQELRGMPVVKAITEKVKREIELLEKRGITPTLAIVRVGDREDDISYERGAKKRFESVGAGIKVVNLPDTCTQEQLEEAVVRLNKDANVHGILIFRPLPKTLSEKRVKTLIAPEKDIDCMGEASLAKLFAGEEEFYPPCTPQAVIELMDYYNIDAAGKKAVILGRSLVVGKPLTMLLLKKNATVTICHTKTADLANECRKADILIAAVGVAKMVSKEYIKENQVVIDVGINMVGDLLCGDVDHENVAPLVEAITPVPGGVGSITTAVLLKHTVRSAMQAV